jgi:hypothetical protein
MSSAGNRLRRIRKTEYWGAAERLAAGVPTRRSREGSGTQGGRVSSTADQVLKDMREGKRETRITNTADQVLRDMRAGRRR